MLHFVMSYMKQNKSRKQTLKSAQYGLEISFKCKLIIITTAANLYANRHSMFTSPLAINSAICEIEEID